MAQAANNPYRVCCLLVRFAKALIVKTYVAAVDPGTRALRAIVLVFLFFK